MGTFLLVDEDILSLLDRLRRQLGLGLAGLVAALRGPHAALVEGVYQLHAAIVSLPEGLPDLVFLDHVHALLQVLGVDDGLLDVLHPLHAHILLVEAHRDGVVRQDQLHVAHPTQAGRVLQPHDLLDLQDRHRPGWSFRALLLLGVQIQHRDLRVQLQEHLVREALEKSAYLDLTIDVRRILWLVLHELLLEDPVLIFHRRRCETPPRR